LDRLDPEVDAEEIEDIQDRINQLENLWYSTEVKTPDTTCSVCFWKTSKNLEVFAQ
jgi:hypothetical protein